MHGKKDTVFFVKISKYTVKKSVITIPYNITIDGISGYLKQLFEMYKVKGKQIFKVPKHLKLVDDEITLNLNELFALAKLLYNTVITQSTPISALINYVQK